MLGCHRTMAPQPSHRNKYLLRASIRRMRPSLSPVDFSVLDEFQSTRKFVLESLSGVLRFVELCGFGNADCDGWCLN